MTDSNIREPSKLHDQLMKDYGQKTTQLLHGCGDEFRQMGMDGPKMEWPDEKVIKEQRLHSADD